MRKVFLFASALMLSLSFTSCERIDAGCEGILVNLYGSERGVEQAIEKRLSKLLDKEGFVLD